MGLLTLKTTSGTPFLISKEDEALVLTKNWYTHGKYIRTRINKKTIYLHRFILDFPKGNVDHIDGNPRNNSRANLRVCTQQQNIMNKRKRKNATSKYKGVSWSKGDKRWAAHIYKDYKSYFLGNYKAEIEAAKAYDSAALKMFKEYAHTNF